MRSGGYGSIGRSSPKVAPLPLTLADTNSLLSVVIVAHRLKRPRPAVQSTSVCGEDLQHAHQVQPLHLPHGGAHPPGLHL